MCSAGGKRVGSGVIGITMGDPAGIGPEIILRALASRRAPKSRFAVFGSGNILRHVAGRFNLPLPQWQAADDDFSGRGPFLIESDAGCPKNLALAGKPSAAGGRAAAAWIEAAVRAAMEGRIAAVVTAPISKEALHRAGLVWPGHTEMIASLTKSAKPVMMMAGGGIRAALVTTHAAINDLPRLITRKAVLDTIRVTHGDLARRFGIARPRLAVCGLNPHAGEAGQFGDEERKAITPAIQAARSEGILCEGPVPADVAFTPARLSSCDAIVAMFHDQATIPVKMIAFDSGVNITLGLPIIRTSPDHGTAYDIVTRGEANPGSMIAAIRLAADLAFAVPAARE